MKEIEGGEKRKFINYTLLVDIVRRVGEGEGKRDC